MLSKEEVKKLEEMTNRCNNCGEIEELGFCPNCYIDKEDFKTIIKLVKEYKRLETENTALKKRTKQFNAK